MASSFNKWIGMGNLTRDPQVKNTAGGTTICELSMALNHKYKNAAGQQIEDVTYVEVVFFGKIADVCGQYLAKGRPVLVEGRLKLDTWDDRETGQKRSKLRVVGESMTMLGGKQDSSGGNRSSESSGVGSQQTQSDSSPDDDVPF